MGFWKQLGTVTRSVGQSLEAVGRKIQGGYSRETLSNHQTLLNLSGKKPVLGDNIFVAPSASIIGDVTLGNSASVWYNAVIRADVNSVSIGEKTNIQDCVVIHCAKHSVKGSPLPTIIGSHCTVGHGAVLHACTVEDGCLIGMGSTLMDGVKVSKGSIVAAGALVPPGAVIPSGEVWAGAPAKYLRKLEEEEVAFIEYSAENYTELAAFHAAENAKTFPEIELDKARRKDRLIRDPDYDSHMGVERDPITREVINVAQST